MIINSNFRDYYDSSHGGWIDKTIVYNRKEELIKDDLLISLNNIQEQLENPFDKVGSITKTALFELNSPAQFVSQSPVDK
jgi:hypothetical protein